ncbi:Integrin beta-5 [Merluccius polli]|uniref:Integrin beta-5 n=1 Tax=Merluccius polli TaxID=89951 RepID=A0AA47NDZ3_MERPO|nr:Integrin beta-5 [Merluccius polli]
MTTVYPSSDSYFQQDNAPCHKARIISDWFLEHDNEFTVLKWPPQSPDLNPIEHLWDVVEREIRIMDVQPTNLQQLRDAIMSIWTKLSEECFQYLVESVPRRIKAVLKAKGGSNVCTSRGASTCKQCLAVHPSCAWCFQEDFGHGSAGSSRCDLKANLIASGCALTGLESPSSKFQVLEDRPLSRKAAGATKDVTQIQPQKLHITLRPADWARMEFKPAKSRSLVLRRGCVQDRFCFKIKEDIIPTVQEKPVKSLGKWYRADINDKERVKEMLI